LLGLEAASIPRPGMRFFEPLPPDPRSAQGARRPEWLGPPENVLGALVSLEIVLGRSDKAFLAITAATAYENGFTFELDIRVRGEQLRELMVPSGVHAYRRHGGDFPDELLRYGLEFADGSKATNLGPLPSHDESRTAPALVPSGGAGGGGRWHETLWVWPLPPPGTLAFVCEWPAAGIGLTRTEIDAALIREASKRAEKLWQDESGEIGPSSVGFVPSPPSA
jgi:hypothetical protein